MKPEHVYGSVALGWPEESRGRSGQIVNLSIQRVIQLAPMDSEQCLRYRIIIIIIKKMLPKFNLI